MNEQVSYFKRALVLLMAVIMVFTYMPNGTWGGAQTAWADENPTVITTSSDFAKMDANGNYKLGADITVNSPYANEFTGTFDGDGHTVTLNINSESNYVGLFSKLAGGAVVKNVTTARSVTASGKNYVGGIAGFANTYAGAITIENCKNTASVSGNEAVGGILGCCTGTNNNVSILNCANIGTVTGSNNKVGGIVGNFEGTHIIKNCYNTGDITGFNNYAGIIGRGAKGVSIQNCYTTGKITAYGTSTNTGYAIIGSATSSGAASSVTNSYALEGCAKTLAYANGVNTYAASGFKTAEEMKAADFADTLGSAFMAKSRDYPALTWETPTAKATFKLSPVNATLTIKDAKNQSKEYTASADGTVSVALAKGTYTYSASCDGYTTSEKTELTVSADDANSGATLGTINVSLSEDKDKWGTVSFSITPSNATIELKDGDNVLTPQDDGAYKVLKNRTYKYKVTTTEEGYEEESGNYCLNTDVDSKSISLKKVKSIALSGEYKTVYTQGDSLDITKLVVTATYSDGSSAPVTITEDDITGFNSAVEMSEGKESVTQTLKVTYKGVSTTYEITINEKTFPSSVFNGLKGKATVEYTHTGSSISSMTAGEEFKDDSSEDTIAIKSQNAGKSSSSVNVVIKINKDVPASRLYFDYKVEVGTSKYTSNGLKINDESYIRTTSGYVTESLDVKGGDTVTLSYSKGSSSWYDSLGSDCMWLKNFQIKELHTVTISPKEGETDLTGATVTLKDSADNAVTAGEDGKYTVVDGSYTYTISKFGYADANGGITVSGADVTEDVAMTKLASRKATFSITLPEDVKDTAGKVAITVKSGTEVVAANEDKSYTLPQGTYSYTIEHPKCVTKTGKITVEESDVNTPITLDRKLVFSDFFDSMSTYLTATDDSTYPYSAVGTVGGSDNYLQSTNKKDSSSSYVDLKANKPVKISFDAWYSVYGSSSTYSNYGLLIKKNNTQLEKKYGTSSDWESFSYKCNTNDELKIGYEYYSSYYGTYDYAIKLKNFTATPLAKVTFTGLPEGASVTVKQGENTIEAETDGGYLLEAGTDYMYSVIAFGYAPITDEAMTVSAEDTTAGSKSQAVTMTKVVTQDVKFSITKPTGIDAAASASVTIKNGDDIVATLPQGDDLSYIAQLPAGEYTYTVSCDGCDDEAGTFTVANTAATVNVALEKKLLFEDLFSSYTDYITATDDATYPFKAVKDKDGNYLESTNKTSTSVVTLTPNKKVRIGFETWYSVYGGYYNTYGLIMQKGSSDKTIKSGISKNWEEYSFDCDADEALKISYNYSKDYYSSDYEYVIRLRNFTVTPLYAASFAQGTDGAAVAVKDAEGNVLTAEADGSYSLVNGTYSYIASKYGYEDKKGNFTIKDADQEVKVPALTEIEKKNITFSVDPADATVTLTHATQGTINAVDGKYSLPKGETYTYTVAKTDYITVNGTLTVKDDETVAVALAYAGAGWDGETKTEPSKVGDVYQIGTAAELAWFANEANTTPTISGKLTANINLNEKTWASFCEYDYSDNSSGFAGTLDGAGHIISGLAGKGGLIDCIAPKGIVKNLRVVGKIENDGSYSDPQHLGGIANTSKGTVENCMFSGKITNKYSGGSTAGIVGRAMSGNVIKNCVSDAELANKCTGYNQNLNLGGIAGYTYGTVENCYFTGSIYADPTKTTNKAIGGIVGTLNGGAALKNSYNVGSVVGPESGIGAVIGTLAKAYSDTPAGVVSNVHYLSGICDKAISTDGGTGTAGTTGHTAADMKTGLFAFTLGSAFNQSSADVNGGYPVLSWQGGSAPVVPEFEQNALADMNAITIKNKTLLDSIEAKKSVYRDYRDEEITTEAQALELWRGFFEGEEGYESYGWDEIYAGFGIDIEEDGVISPDSDSVYRLPEDCTTIYLPVKGENGSTITWTSSTSDSEAAIAVDASEDDAATTSATVTRPTEGGNQTIILTATVKNNNITKSKAYKILVTSPSGVAAETLDAIADQIKKSSTYIQPMQMYDHENITDAMVQYLDRQGYDTEEYCGDGIKVELVSIGTKDMPNDGVEYLAADGTINSYYKGTAGFSTTSAIYNNVTFKLSLEGVTKEVTIHVHIGWDVFYVEEMLEKALKEVTWDSIKGDNTNASTDTDEATSGDGWKHTTVDGSISQNLTVPTSLSKYSYAKISWSTVGDDDYNYIYFETEDDGTTSAILQRPPKADEGEPSNDKDISLRATATFNFWDDYTVSEMTSQGSATEPATAFKFFDMTIAEGTEAEKAEMKQALIDKYPGLIRDFVDKEQTVNMNEITDDLQLPRPSILQDNGIMSDSYNQKVTMTSSDTDVLEFMGYHAVIYRPLPGEDAKTVEYTVTITDRRTKNVLAKNTFEMTVLPLTQKEIDDAAAWMKTVTTEDVYWNGIKGENTSKDNVTSNLKAFEEIHKNADGGVEYIYGTINITFDGIDVDDLPGYDSMKSQPWREYRSDDNGVIECETLFVTTPEYDTQVTIDSVFTDNTFGKYWEKFQADEDYAQFEQFYKQPVSVTVTVKGEKGTDPNPTPKPTSLSAKVTIDGKNTNGFKSTSAITVSGLSKNATAWDAVTAALKEGGYTYSNFGDYIESVTDKNGVTLADDDTANSGWLYTVNGKLADVYLGAYYIKNNDTINFYYTSDYTKDEQASQWSGSSTTTDKVTTSETTGTMTTTTQTETKVTEQTAADGTKEKVATVTVSSSNQKELLKQAKANKSKEIVLQVAKDSMKDASKAEVQLDKSFVNSILNDTDATVTVETPLGNKTYTQAELKDLAASATGSTITLTVDKSNASVDTTDELNVAAEVAKLTPVARSSKTAKKNIKVTTSLDKSDKAIIAELKDAGYTIKYRFYRSTKKASSYKAKLTGTTGKYTNTAGKKGTRYYYKVQIRVYDKDGKLVAKTALKQCKYATRKF